MPTQKSTEICRRVIDRGRIDEMRGYGWRVIAPAPGAAAEWAVVMEGAASACPSRWGAWA